MEPIEGRECYHCGDICGEIELNKCEQCGCEVCDNCVVKCTGCGGSICKVCGVYDGEQLQWFCCDECRQEWYLREQDQWIFWRNKGKKRREKKREKWNKMQIK
jgi:hypothetical protein